jgi:glycosyltransferase involved in cell wall biosynthesis
MRPPGRVVVVMPAYKAARTLERTVSAIPREWVDEIVLVDDNSPDGTLQVARGLDIKVLSLPHNVGYGGNQKTCYLQALQERADAVIMLHPDGQYEPEIIPRMVEPILRGEADFVMGSRMAAAREGGMPLWKRLGNRALTAMENRIVGTTLSELHSGYRAFSRPLLEGVPFLRNSDDFVFDSEMLMQASYFGYRIVEVPARSRYFADASSVDLRQSLVYGVKTLWVALRLVLHRSGVLRSRKFQA